MSMQDFKGSAFAEWLLPIIPIGARLSERSNIEPDNIGKIPGIKYPTGWTGFPRWTQARIPEKALAIWDSWYYPSPATIGLQSGLFPGFDLDVNESWQADIAREVAFRICGETIVRGREGSPRQLLMYRLDQSGPPISKLRRVYGCEGAVDEFAVEILGKGQQYLIEGMHKSGTPYVWSGGADPLSYGVENIPRITLVQVIEYVQELDNEFKVLSIAPVRPKQLRGDGGRGEDAKEINAEHPEVAPDLATLTEVLGFINVLDPELESYDDWERCARAIKTACAGDEGFYDLTYLPWQLENPENDDDAVRQKWASHTSSSVGFGYLEGLAARRGYIPSGAGLFEALGPGDDAVDDPGEGVGQRYDASTAIGSVQRSQAIPGPAGPAGPTRPADQERAIADRWVGDVARRSWIYVPMSAARGVWRHFENGVWEETQPPMYALSEYCAAVGDQLRADARSTKEELTRARWLSSAHAATNTTSLAKSNPRITVKRTSLDAHALLMGVPGGYIDAKGELQKPDPSLLITRTAAVAPAPGPCPRWERLIYSLCNYDYERFRSMRACLGYTVTGTGQEQKFFFLHGDQGHEGKSSMLRCLALVMGEYSVLLPDSAFVAGRGGQDNKFAFAGLEGAWYAYTSEIGRDEVWHDGRLKSKTGSTSTMIERKGFDVIEIPIRFGLWFQGNFLPRFPPSADEALKRRLVIFECLTQIDEVDDEKDWANVTFAQEGPQILQWLIEARADYLRDVIATRNPLQLTGDMIQHRDEYLNSQDALRLFIEATFVFDRTAPDVATQDVFGMWTMWRDSQGFDAQLFRSCPVFSRALQAHPLCKKANVRSEFRGKKLRRQWVLTGLRIKEDDNEPEEIVNLGR